MSSCAPRVVKFHSGSTVASVKPQMIMHTWKMVFAWLKRHACTGSQAASSGSVLSCKNGTKRHCTDKLDNHIGKHDRKSSLCVYGQQTTRGVQQQWHK